MKNLLFLVLLAIGSSLYAQTDSIEKAIFHERLLSQKISPEDFSKIGMKWNETIKKMGQYPDLPLDQNGQVHYIFLHNFSNVSKEKLFNRTMEWIAINYGLFPTNLYSNLEDGKIILTNGFAINNIYSGNFTCVFSIKDAKMLVEFYKIGYQGFYPGHNSGDSWIPDRTVNLSIDQVFPVILKNQSEWNFNLDLLKTTNEHFKNNISNLWDYLTNYDLYTAF